MFSRESSMPNPLRFGILTASDRSSRGERPDLSGPALADLVQSRGDIVVRTAILPDDMAALRDTMAEWCDSGGMDVLLVSAGTCRSDARRESQGHAACHALARRVRDPAQDDHHQFTRKPESRSGKLAGGAPGAWSRGGIVTRVSAGRKSSRGNEGEGRPRIGARIFEWLARIRGQFVDVFFIAEKPGGRAAV
jgi:hypothetical protein